MRSRRLPIGLVLPAALILLVALLATLQYKWLGQVSEAERERMRTSLHQNAEDLATDFDRELADVYRTLQVDGAPLSRHDWAPFAARYDTWRERAKDPRMVKAVYLANAGDAGTDFYVYRPEAREFDSASWPDSLASVKASLLSNRESVEMFGARTSMPAAAGSSWQGAPGMTGKTLMALKTPLFPDVPALVITVPSVQPTQNFPMTALTTMVAMRFNTASIIVELDREYIRTTLLPALVARHFPRSVDQYRFAVVETAAPSKAVFSRGLAADGRLDPQRADANVPLFALRLDLAQVVVRTPTVTTSRPLADSTFTFESHTFGSAPTGRSASNFSIVLGSRGDMAPAGPRGAWQLMVQHTAGSLDAAVGQARRRNLWLSFGILGVLAAGVTLMVINAERSRKLAVQQMDFVATVSHELRTPLTVIRSAAQNLSAGVVSDPAQAKRYGDLIESEGRRLTDMVEQVLEYAGLSGNRKLAHAQPVDVGAVARDVVESSAALFEAERVDVQVQIADDLPSVLADEGAVRRALNNLLTNALKYGADGRWIGLTARRGGLPGTGSDEVQLSVSDRGRGIEADDLPHIFDAFYRGRYTVDRQIHGNGLGLSLVRRIADAHGGKVTVSSVPGQGATFTIHLPAAAADPSAIPPHADPLAAPGTPTA